MAFSKTSIVGAMVGAAALACFFAIRQGSEGSAMPMTIYEASLTNTAATGLVEAGSRRILNDNTVASVIGDVSDESSAWKNDLNVVHVVNTEFMIHQAKLKHLGSARLDLFKTFTLPSMIRQTNQQFLWLVWTDAELEKEILGEFLELVAPLRNVIVIGAVRMPETNLRTMYGHNKNSLAWLREVVLSGDVELLSEYYKASQTHLLLETNVDADDALSYKFIETVQAEAAFTIGQNLEDDVERAETFCPEYHAEWRYFAPENSVSDEGHLVQLRNEKFCIGSGSSVAFHLKAAPHRALCNEFVDHPACDRRSLADRQLCNKKSRKLNELELDYGDNTMCETQDIPEGAQTILYGPMNKSLPESMCPTGSFICNGFNDEEGGLMTLFTADDIADLDELSGVTVTCIPEFCQQHVLFFDVIVQKRTGQNDEVVMFIVDYLGAKSYMEYAPCDPYLSVDYKMTRTYAELEGTSNTQIVEWSPTLPTNDTLVHGTHIFSYHTLEGLEAFSVCVAPVEPVLEHRFCLRNLRLLPSDEDNSVKKLDASVLLSRTPTAAGMKSVMPDSNNDEQKNSVVLSTYGEIKSEAQAKAWESMETNFGIKHDDVVALRGRMEDNLEHILLDAFSGQCTPGHSCNDSTKRALGKLLDNARN